MSIERGRRFNSTGFKRDPVVRETGLIAFLDATSPFRNPSVEVSDLETWKPADDEGLVGTVTDGSDGEHLVAFCGHATHKEFGEGGNICRVIGPRGQLGCRRWREAVGQAQYNAASAAAPTV